MATRRFALRTAQNSRSRRILALIPEENAPSDVSGESNSENEDELANVQFGDPESSEPPSLDSSLERLNILNSDSDADQHRSCTPSPSILANNGNVDDINTEHTFDFTLPSISSCPLLTPMSNIPSITTSYILDHMSDSPLQSPLVASLWRGFSGHANCPVPNRNKEQALVLVHIFPVTRYLCK
ncbi:uncharacterized protein LOC114366528 [Ostrinia furnacalis]|uniref:uncharacterized protein LOC114366528 n=1 Tax=Ostrinia furnacalis TaxID=93504 RepID=UPI00103952ED|nr:uncharacterized protein LOC114366528 [Ostrinia furnacalis]